MAVKSFLEAFTEAAAVRSDLALINLEFALQWLTHLRSEICEIAQTEALEARDYACTIVGAVIGPAHSTYVQIGDGAIIVSSKEAGEYSHVFWPQHGEFANQTNFVTQDRAEDALAFRQDSGRIDEIALFSDGIERLVLDWSAKTVHSPSFQPIFGWLVRTEPVEPINASDALTTYLGSDHINRRTDDDKTLVIATRVAPTFE